VPPLPPPQRTPAHRRTTPPTRATDGSHAPPSGYASATAAMDEGAALFASGRWADAARSWEAALLLNPTLEERQRACYGCAVVHSGFGDIELARMAVRDLRTCGGDWTESLRRGDSTDPEDAGWPRLESSTQVKIQLRRFWETLERGGSGKRPLAPGMFPATGYADGGPGGANREGGAGAPGAVAGKRAPAPTPASASTSASSMMPPLGPRGTPDFGGLMGTKAGSDDATQMSGSTDASEMLQTDIDASLDVTVAGVARRVGLLVAVLVGGGVVLYIVGLKVLFPQDEAPLLWMGWDGTGWDGIGWDGVGSLLWDAAGAPRGGEGGG